MERRNVKLGKTLEVLKVLRERNISIDDLIETIEVIHELEVKGNTTEEEQKILVDLEDETLKSTEIEVTKQLHKFGIPSNVKGFYFIRTGILMGLQLPECVDAICKVMYPCIAKEYKTTSSRVERAIRHAIEVACTRGSLEEVLKFFPCYDTSHKVTNKEFLTTMIDYYKVI